MFVCKITMIAILHKINLKMSKRASISNCRRFPYFIYRRIESIKKELWERKLWSSGGALGSRSEGRGFNPCPMLDGSGVKAMPGSILTPNSGSL